MNPRPCGFLAPQPVILRAAGGHLSEGYRSCVWIVFGRGANAVVLNLGSRKAIADKLCGGLVI